MYKRRPRGVKRRILFILFTLLLIFNINHIGRFFYPFPYRQTVFNESRAHGLDPCLVAAVIKTESNFNPRAVSPRGARGLMQIMPDTGLWVAGQTGMRGFQPEWLDDPEINIRFGSWYLSDLYREFNGDTVLVLAAYNGGRGNVEKWLEQEHWTGQANSLDQIPFPETRDFVRKVLWNYKAYRYLYGTR